LTIAKLIICDVDIEKRGDFSNSQCSWDQLSNCAGFGGQAGGWEDSSSTAIILGFWESQFHVSEFMRTTHDEVFQSSEQESTYRNCSVNYFKLVSTISGSSMDFARGGLFRITYCSGITDIDKFKQDQERIWNPQLSLQPGMLGGHVWCHVTYDDYYMVVTHWASKDAHEKYTKGLLLTLREQVCPSDYIAQLSASQVELETLWSVAPNR
jgi:heme-degrading monooxygenase HmoA